MHPHARANCIIVSVGVLVLLASTPRGSYAAPTLTGVGVFPTSAAGQWGGLHLWNTEPDGFYWNLFLADGSATGPLLNGPTNDLVRPSIPLVPGTYTFGVLGERPLPSSGYDPGHAAINLYLDGANNPTLSALTETTFNNAFTPLSGSVPGPVGQPVTAANALSWTDGQYTVTLTDFDWVVNDTSIDRVGGFDAMNPLGAPDLHGTFTLSVVPEPGGITFVSVICTALIARRRHAHPDTLLHQA